MSYARLDPRSWFLTEDAAAAAARSAKRAAWEIADLAEAADAILRTDESGRTLATARALAWDATEECLAAEARVLSVACGWSGGAL